MTTASQPNTDDCVTLLRTRQMADYFERISHPALTDINIDWGGMQVTEVYPREMPDLFVSRVTPMGNHSVDEVLIALYAEIDRIKTEPIQQAEIDKVISQMDADFIRSLSSNNGIARRIGDMEQAGDARTIVETIVSLAGHLGIGDL